MERVQTKSNGLRYHVPFYCIALLGLWSHADMAFGLGVGGWTVPAWLLLCICSLLIQPVRDCRMQVSICLGYLMKFGAFELFQLLGRDLGIFSIVIPIISLVITLKGVGGERQWSLIESQYVSIVAMPVFLLGVPLL